MERQLVLCGVLHSYWLNFCTLLIKFHVWEKNVNIEIPTTAYGGGILNLYYARRHSRSYFAARPAEYTELKVRTVHRGR